MPPGWCTGCSTLDFADRPALTAAVKIPGFLFGIALTLFLSWTVWRLTGDRARADWVALAYWANPATVLNGEVLGYLDPLMMLPAIASLVLLHLRAPEWAGASLAIAMLTKPQALLVAPILALGAWRTGGMRALVAAAAGGVVTAGVIFLPYALIGALPNVWLAFGSFYARRDILSGYAANIWWIVNYVLRAWYQIPQLGWVGRVSRAGAANPGGQHVPGARVSEPAAARRRRSCCSRAPGACGGSGAAAISRSMRSARHSSSTPSSCCRSACTNTT